MSMRKVELFFSTEEQVREFIEYGLALVDDIEPPEDLREAVFVQAVTLRQARHVQWEQIGLGMAIPRNQG